MIGNIGRNVRIEQFTQASMTPRELAMSGCRRRRSTATPRASVGVRLRQHSHTWGGHTTEFLRDRHGGPPAARRSRHPNAPPWSCPGLGAPRAVTRSGAPPMSSRRATRSRRPVRPGCHASQGSRALARSPARRADQVHGSRRTTRRRCCQRLMRQRVQLAVPPDPSAGWSPRPGARRSPAQAAAPRGLLVTRTALSPRRAASTGTAPPPGAAARPAAGTRGTRSAPAPGGPTAGSRHRGAPVGATARTRACRRAAARQAPWGSSQRPPNSRARSSHPVWASSTRSVAT